MTNLQFIILILLVYAIVPFAIIAGAVGNVGQVGKFLLAVLFPAHMTVIGMFASDKELKKAQGLGIFVLCAIIACAGFLLGNDHGITIGVISLLFGIVCGIIPAITGEQPRPPW